MNRCFVIYHCYKRQWHQEPLFFQMLLHCKGTAVAERTLISGAGSVVAISLSVHCLLLRNCSDAQTWQEPPTKPSSQPLGSQRCTLCIWDSSHSGGKLTLCLEQWVGFAFPEAQPSFYSSPSQKPLSVLSPHSLAKSLGDSRPKRLETEEGCRRYRCVYLFASCFSPCLS